MREIEFRGKRLFDNKWFYGYLFIYHDAIGKEFYDLLNEKEEVIVNHIGQKYPAMYEIKKDTLGQYTGLKDKNEKKIFEGDILQYDGGGIYMVVFDEMMIMCPHDNIEMPSPGYYGILIGDTFKELCPLGVTQRLAKVIGNIYDNPELLKEEL